MALPWLDQDAYLPISMLMRWRAFHENRLFNSGCCVTDDYLKTVLKTMAPITDVNQRSMYGIDSMYGVGRKKLRANIHRTLHAPYVLRVESGTQSYNDRDQQKRKQHAGMDPIPCISLPHVAVSRMLALVAGDQTSKPRVRSPVGPSVRPSQTPRLPSPVPRLHFPSISASGVSSTEFSQPASAVSSEANFRRDVVPHKPGVLLYRRPRAGRTPGGDISRTDSWLSSWRTNSFATVCEDNPLDPEGFYMTHYPLILMKVPRRRSGKRPLWYTSGSLDMSFFKDEMFSRFAVNALDSDDSDDDRDGGNSNDDEEDDTRVAGDILCKPGDT